MDKYKLKLYGSVAKFKLMFNDKDYLDKLGDFYLKNFGHSFSMTLEVTDSPAYFQHKYYRGQLVPDIAHNESEVDLNYVHEKLKEKFLFKRVGFLQDIPSKYRKGCTRFVNNHTEIIGYTPSTANLTYEEMKWYIDKCEKYLDKIGGHLGDCGHILSSIEEIRNSALGVE